ncbi:HAD family phosphatase [Chryseoglobus sp. 28M-23]|uniref:HAD family hydrolase n=1 Tax=Chryseoglobus sp. 28M-23 TaxID=2772253 RepID=UPI001CD0617E|nr:HAD family phosphatase [Chryseoglobus sp. 28M-23]
MTTPIRPSAVLWDMDGTIVDTEPYWMRAEVDLVTSHGGVWTEADGMQLVGSGLVQSARILQQAGVDLPVESIIDALTDRVMAQIEKEVPWRPGARELIEHLRDAGIPIALVTMSIRRMALQVAAAIGDDVFDIVVAGDDVANPKPHPEPYLRAAELLGVDIADCVALEDSQFGLVSAVSSGAATIGIPLHLTLHEGPTHELWPSLAGRSVDDLSAALARHQHRATGVES